jgi:hypothetical protein
MEEMGRKDSTGVETKKGDEYFLVFCFLSWRDLDFYGVLCTAENRRI